MSYDLGPELESGQYSDIENYASFQRALSDKVTALSGRVNQFSRDVKDIRFARKLHRLQEECAELTESLKTATVQMDQLMRHRDVTEIEAYTRVTFNQKFQLLLEDFHRAQGTLQENSQTLLQQMQDASEVDASQVNSRPPEQMQAQAYRLVDDVQLDEQTSRVVARDADIQRIVEDIEALGAISRQVGELVVEQGFQLDRIDDNVADTEYNTERGRRNLEQAHRTQKRTGKWSCYFLMILAVVLSIIILAVLA